MTKADPPPDSKYVHWYNALINKRKEQPLDKKNEFAERHHIIPKCLGGDNSKSNIVVLTFREHYIAHILLCKAYSGTKWHGKLLSAVIYMVAPKSRPRTRSRLRFSSRVYASIRKRYAQSMVGHFGRLPADKQREIREKQRALCLGKKLTEEHKRKIGEGCIGRKMPESQRLATSERMKKRMLEFKRPVRCVETGVVYASVLDAEKANPSCPTVSRCCRGINATSGGLHFEFVDSSLAAQFSKRKLKPKDEYVIARAKKIYCRELDMCFKSACDCSRKLCELGYKNSRNHSIGPHSIRNVAKGKLESCGGLHFQFIV